MIERWASLGDFARRAARVPRQNRIGGDGSYGDMGATSYDECVRKSLTGDDRLVSKAAALYDLIDSAVEVPMPAYQPSVYGAYPCVPEVLAGEPQCMRLMKPQYSATSPITIMVATDPACGVNEPMMVTRGIAIIALVMKLNQIRPIKLTLLSENVCGFNPAEEHLIAVDVDTQPLDLATACFAIAGSGWARHLAFSVVKDLGHRVAWPSLHSTDLWIPHLHKIGILQSQDLFIPAARVEGDGDGDLYKDIYSNPVAWVNRQVARLTNEEELNV